MGRGGRSIVVVVALALGACGRGGGAGPVTGPTVPPGEDGPSTTTSAVVTTTTAPVSYDVPDTIDQAYVQRVVSAYDQVLGDAIRVLKREGRITDEFLEHLVGIYTAEEFEFQQRAWLEAEAEGRSAKTPEAPGNPVTSIIRVDRADRTCIVARAERDYTRTLLPGVEQATTENDQYVVLVPAPEGRDPADVNPTPWVISFDGSKKDNSVPEDSCA